MNDLYNETIERRGRVYRYDPDHDCYYAVEGKITGFDQYAWIVTIVIMSAVCIYVEFIQ